MRNRIGKTQIKELELEKTICKELEKRFEMSNSEAKNVYNKAESAYSSQFELTKFYIEDSYERIKGQRKAIKTLEAKLSKAESSGHKASVRKIKRYLHFKQQKINKIDAKIVRLNSSRNTGHFTVTFGRSKLFEKQHRLEENGYKNKEEWLKDWRSARYNRSFFIGSKNYQGGNQLVRYDADLRTLTITVTPKLRAKYGDTVTFHNISFAYVKSGYWQR